MPKQLCTLLRTQLTDRQGVAGRGGLGKMLEQEQQVLATLAQRRDAQGGDIQAVIEVSAEAALVGGLAQILLGRGDHPDVQRDRLVATESLDDPLLQHAQQLYLDIQAHALDLV